MTGDYFSLIKHILFTVILFTVNVPVLSDQITVVHPRVSHDDNSLIIAFLAASFLDPNANHVVITAGRPYGMAATASEIAILK